MAEAQTTQATGRRKNAVAQVRLTPGQGQMTVNKRPALEYLQEVRLVLMALEPLELTSATGRYDIIARCTGGGLVGQAGALRHGIARALAKADPSVRPTLRRTGLLTRDPRMKERKKWGFKRARRGFQFSKR